MKTLLKLPTLMWLFALATVAGCDGTDTSSEPSALIAGISGNGVAIAIGPVATFGSIVVNGVHYDTTNTIFMIDGSAATEADLKVGQIVFVKGAINADLASGNADSVDADDNVTGPIDSIDLARSQLIVMGQLVFVNADTSFDNNISPASLEGLAVDDIVEVSGFFTAEGATEATRIEKKPAGTRFEVHGFVSNHDATNFIFSINDLVVDYSNASLDDFPSGQISDDDFVEAKGNNIGTSDQLVANSVEFEGAGIDADEGDHVEVEGLITRFVSETDFDVAGIAVTTNGDTEFEGGGAADLALNIKVEVEGTLDANGILVADKVDIRRSKAVRATAVVDSVNAADNTLVMLGITFVTDNLTRFEDKSSADLRPLTINDITAGDYLEIRGAETPAGSGQILASILEREDLDSETILQGFVSNVADPTVTILGVTIETNGAVFEDVDDNTISAVEFFNQVDVNSLVKAKGTESSATTITASEVEFED